MKTLELQRSDCLSGLELPSLLHQRGQPLPLNETTGLFMTCESEPNACEDTGTSEQRTMAGGDVDQPPSSTEATSHPPSMDQARVGLASKDLANGQQVAALDPIDPSTQSTRQKPTHMVDTASFTSGTPRHEENCRLRQRTS